MSRTTSTSGLLPVDPFAAYAARAHRSEIYEVVRTAVVAVSGGMYRLDVVKRHTFDGTWSSHHFGVQAYRQEACRSDGGDPILVWASWVGFPSVHQGDADDALADGLGWLEERTASSPKG